MMANKDFFFLVLGLVLFNKIISFSLPNINIGLLVLVHVNVNRPNTKIENKDIKPKAIISRLSLLNSTLVQVFSAALLIKSNFVSNINQSIREFKQLHKQPIRI